MESHSDRSSSLSADSGGLIDLYALDSDCKIGDSSQTSLGEACCIVVLLQSRVGIGNCGHLNLIRLWQSSTFICTAILKCLGLPTCPKPLPYLTT